MLARFPLLLLLIALPLFAAERPNIVFILADDLGYGDLACYGAPDIRTPNLDRLAAEGVKFTQFYANAPECTPTRTALLTGEYPQRIGGMECAIGTGNVGRYPEAKRLSDRHDLGLPAADAVIPSAFRAAGYSAAIYGKWHLGYEAKFNPLRHGWEEWLGCIAGNVDHHTLLEQNGELGWYHNEKPRKQQGYSTHLLTDAALNYLESRAGQRFFLYLPYTAPHFPFQAPANPTPADPKKWTEGTRADYIAMVEDMDQQIGRVLQWLETKGLRDNTIVIFTSDNGAQLPGRNLPYRAFKSTTFEGGLRVPCIVRWPGRIPAGMTSDQPTMTFDLTRSLLSIAGAATKPDRPLDGMDILQHVMEKKPVTPRNMFWRFKRGDNTWWAARRGDLKYIRSTDEKGTQEFLFDLAADPTETRDLLTSHADAAESMRQLLANWEKDVEPRR